MISRRLSYRLLPALFVIALTAILPTAAHAGVYNGCHYDGTNVKECIWVGGTGNYIDSYYSSTSRLSNCLGTHDYHLHWYLKNTLWAGNMHIVNSGTYRQTYNPLGCAFGTAGYDTRSVPWVHVSKTVPSNTYACMSIVRHNGGGTYSTEGNICGKVT